jgi:diacylglycerol kinase family enzyme
MAVPDPIPGRAPQEAMDTPRQVRVLVVYNPRSGRGRGVRAARGLHGGLDGEVIGGRRCAVELLELGGGGGGGGEVCEALQRADVLAVAGGDGSVHHLAPLAIAAGVPMYHVPCGNENLLAREFGMDDSPAALRRALEAWRVVCCDVARCEINGAEAGHVLLMCSLGPDASIIHRLSVLRTRALGHLAYVQPVLQELVSPRFSNLSVRVDGEEVVGGECGMLVVANSRQYALRIDPAARASMTDGLLDAVFLPCVSRARFALWGVRSRLRRHAEHPEVVYRQGRVIEVGADGAPFQIDGECPGATSGMLEGVMRLEVRAGVLPILAAPG